MYIALSTRLTLILTASEHTQRHIYISGICYNSCAIAYSCEVYMEAYQFVRLITKLTFTKLSQ